MKSKLIIIAVLCAIAIGCAGPVTLDERLSWGDTKRNSMGNVTEYMQYSNGFQYANAARLNKGDAAIIATKTDFDAIESVSFTLLNIAVGDFSGALGQALVAPAGSNATLNSEYNKSSKFVTNQGVQYYLFQEKEGTATEADLDEQLAKVMTLFNQVYNSDGTCTMDGWTESRQYSGVYIRDGNGIYKEYVYNCPNEAFPGLLGRDTDRVSVRVVANPVAGVRTVAMLERVCHLGKEKGEYVNTDSCGWPLAEKQAQRAGNLLDKEGWMRLVVSYSEEKGRLVVTSDQNGKRVSLPGVAVSRRGTDEFASNN